MSRLRVLVYKRTHMGDPDDSGCFGAHDCMGTVRARAFDAVIGVGGVSSQAQASGVAGKVNWIGIGPNKTLVPGMRGPSVMFEHFCDFGTTGPDFRSLAPSLAERMYANNIRHVMDDLSDQEYLEVEQILRPAKAAPPSPRYRRGRGTRPRLCGDMTRAADCPAW